MLRCCKQRANFLTTFTGRQKEKKIIVEVRRQNSTGTNRESEWMNEWMDWECLSVLTLCDVAIMMRVRANEPAILKLDMRFFFLSLALASKLTFVDGIFSIFVKTFANLIICMHAFDKIIVVLVCKAWTNWGFDQLIKWLWQASALPILSMWKIFNFSI